MKRKMSFGPCLCPTSRALCFLGRIGATESGLGQRWSVAYRNFSLGLRLRCTQMVDQLGAGQSSVKVLCLHMFSG